MRSWTSKTGGKGIAGENSILGAIIQVASDGLGSYLCAIDKSSGAVLVMEGGAGVDAGGGAR
jgi:hypothetical protein